MKLSSNQVLDRVDVAEACGRHANLEQHLADAPWKMALLTHAINQTRKIGVVLAVMEWSVSEGNSIEWSSEFWMKVPESCSAEVDVMREMASMIKTEVLAELNVTRERLHQMASDFVDCNTLTSHVSSYRSTFRAEVKSHTSCRKGQQTENDVLMACEKF